MHPWVHRYGLAVGILSVLSLGMAMGDGGHPLNASGAMPMVIAGFLVVSALDTHRALGLPLSGRPGAV